MNRIREATAGKRTAVVTIRHVGAWDEGRHGAAFLRPLVAGILRRAAATARENNPAPPGG
jgi:hypothetical protein